MKVLTIREPWASLIINGYKKYEFRSWKTKYRGKLLIHAGSTLEKNMISKYKDYNLDYKMGYIIGEVNLVDCIKVDKDFNDMLKNENNLVYGNSNHIDKYAWKLEDIVIYKEPIYVKGKLGLWDYQGDISNSYSKINK